MAQQAHLHFIKYALAAGHAITVWNGGDEAEIELSKKYEEIKEHSESADEAKLLTYTDDGKYMGWVYVVHDFVGQPPEEIIADYTCTDFNEAWNKQYYIDNPDA
jgi:hypothetical protein